MADCQYDEIGFSCFTLPAPLRVSLKLLASLQERDWPYSLPTVSEFVRKIPGAFSLRIIKRNTQIL